MKRSTVVVVMIAMLVAAPGRVSAQVVATGSAVLAPGQRVRVTATAPAFTGITVGNLVKIGPDNLTLVDAEGGVVLELPRTSITRVEVSHQTRATKKGLLIGLGVGALGGAALAAGPSWFSEGNPCARPDEPDRECSSGEKVGFFVAGLAVWGGIGAWIGSRKKTDHWKDARMEDWMASGRALTWQVSPTLSRGGHGAGLRLRLTW